MKTLLGINYYEIGDSVRQKDYPGCPAKIIEIYEQDPWFTLYTIEIDATGHPEAIDENGEPEIQKFAYYSRETLNHLNNATDLRWNETENRYT